MLRLKHKAGAVVAAAASVAGMVFAAAPASATVAAYPTSDFSIEVGASYYKGTVTWYNRSVSVNGAFKASGCRRVYAEAIAGTDGSTGRVPALGATNPDRRPFTSTPTSTAGPPRSMSG